MTYYFRFRFRRSNGLAFTWNKTMQLIVGERLIVEFGKFNRNLSLWSPAIKEIRQKPQIHNLFTHGSGTEKF